jgi:FkbM family methyltransferase
METITKTIGGFEIEIPHGHIYTYHDLPEHYDKGPWSFIASLISNIKTELTLVDIGANVGDSAAYWRSFNKGKCICIEPSNYFFSLLEKNTQKIGNCHIINSIYNADISINNLVFTSGSQTGTTKISEDSNILDTYKGSSIGLDEILKISKSQCIFKTDTDGFDEYIIQDMIEKKGDELTQLFPIIFFEGPSYEQMELNSFQNCVKNIRKLQIIGYNVTIFSNTGTLFSYVGSDFNSLISAFNGLYMSINSKKAYCHYFDIICSRNDLYIYESIRNLTPINNFFR